MTREHTRTLIETSIFAAIIFLSVQVFRIPVGPQFIHFGNALVVIGVLIFGFKRGTLAASIGLGLFDILNGYVTESWITVLEAIIVCVIVHLIFDKVFNKKDKTGNIIVIGIVAAVVKIIENTFKYTLTGMLVANLNLVPAMLLAFSKIIGTFGSSLVTVIAVPILYPILKRLASRK